MECDQILFTSHAVKKMFKRSIRRTDVVRVVHSGEIIAEYPDDEPFPSYLALGFIEGQPIHVVVAVDAGPKDCYVITAYEPDPIRWESDFRTRRPS